MSRAAVAGALVLMLAGCTSDVVHADAGGTPPSAVTTTPAPTSDRTTSPSPVPGPSASSASASPAPATPAPGSSASASPAPSPASSSPSPTQPSPLPTPAPPVVTPAPQPVAEPESLRSGDEGDAVTQLQTRLVALGYFLPAVDGTFGPNTLQAVWALQKAAGLSRDGVVGPDTRAALDAGARPTPRSTTGQVLEVDLDAQLVMAVQDGQIVAIINASSGSGAHFEALGTTHTAHTPTGDFTVVQQIDGMHDSTLGLGEMFRPKYFRGGWAVHGSPSVPPYPASHGCVRVTNAAIDWIWDVFGAPVGTPVLVYRG